MTHLNSYLAFLNEHFTLHLPKIVLQVCDKHWEGKKNQTGKCAMNEIIILVKNIIFKQIKAHYKETQVC